MRKNLPVTNIETPLPDDEFIYSRTDLKGMIVEANDAFARVSGFRQEEMVGEPHNIVRHPDMPEAAFADLWADLKAGRPWRGLVKNRRKDGGYYWVVANASPVREDGQVVGYQSVRSKPAPEEVREAEIAYRRIREGDKSIYIQHGRVVRRVPGWVSLLLSLRTQMVIVALALLIQCGISLYEWSINPEPAMITQVEAAFGLFGILFGLYFLFVFTPHVNRDLDNLSRWLMTLLSTGNLSQRFDLSRRDLIGSIARRADKFVSSIQATVQGMADMARQVERASREVGQAVEVVKYSAAEQSEATSSAAAALEQLTVSITEVASHTRDAREIAVNAGELSKTGAERSGQATSTILLLAGTVKESATQVNTLGERAAEISRIVGVIKDIADQTNLLALNAAIEAARAGEAGRGFAVVADEVRKLAERTTLATQEIAQMIGPIQADTQKAVEGMRTGASQVEQGVEFVRLAEQALNTINTEMARTASMVSDIAHASQEQQSAMTALARNVEQVSGMTENNSAVVVQTDRLVGDLTQVVERMQKSVQQFKV